MKWPWDSNSRRCSVADLVCSAPYLPNLLLGEKNVLIKVIFLVTPNFQCCTRLLWTHFWRPSTQPVVCTAIWSCHWLLFNSLSSKAENMEQRDGLRRLLASQAPLCPGPCSLTWLWQLYVSSLAAQLTVFLLDFFQPFKQLPKGFFVCRQTLFTHSYTQTHVRTCFPSLDLHVLAKAPDACRGSGSNLKDVLGARFQPWHSGAGIFRLQSGITVLFIILQNKKKVSLTSAACWSALMLLMKMLFLPSHLALQFDKCNVGRCKKKTYIL